MGKQIMKVWVVRALLAFCLIYVFIIQETTASRPIEHSPGTFSIVAYDSTTGELGVAVQSKSLAVGNAVPYAVPGIGAVATQAKSNLSYGPEGISLLKIGLPVEQVVDILTSKDVNREVRV